MAGNQILITVAGDSQSLEKAFDRVGNSAKDMAKDLDKSAKDGKDSFSKLGDGADVGEQRIIGFRDAITGTGDVMKGFKEGDMTLVLTGFADLASSIANFVVPLLGKLVAKLGLTTLATNVMTGAQAALNAVMALNPITLVVIALAALAAAFVLAWKHSETFRNIVRGAMETVSDAVGWVKDRFGDLVNFIGGLPSRIANVARGMFDGIKEAFKGAINWVIDRMNGLKFDIGGWEVLGKKAPTVTVDLIPGGIPRLHTGGIVPGSPGQEVPIMALAGERVLSPGQSKGGGGVTVIVQGNVLDGRQLADMVQAALLKKQTRSGSLGFVAA